MSKRKLTRPRWETRTEIVSFRLRATEAKMLADDLKAAPAAGVKSLKQYARKITIDFARGRLAYIDPRDRKVDSSVRESKHMESAPSDCFIPDAIFLRRLWDLLHEPENWRKIRSFMLLLGLPTDLAKAFQEAESDQRRMEIARRFIDDMIINYDDLYAQKGEHRNSDSDHAERRGGDNAGRGQHQHEPQGTDKV